MNNLIKIDNVHGYLDENNIVWLNLEDVARGLGIMKIDKKENKEYIRINKQALKMWLIEFGIINSEENLPEFIQENIFYRLCMKAKNEAAIKFQENVCDNILPQIRKTGIYLTDNIYNLIMQDPEKFGQMLIDYGKTKKENKQLKLDNKIKDQQIIELQPKAQYTDIILQCKDLVTITTIAKDYGKSGKYMNELLHKLGIQYKESGIWFLYQKYAECGYTQTKTFNIDEEKCKVHTYWTQKGRLFLYNLLRENDILPLIEKEEDDK